MGLFVRLRYLEIGLNVFVVEFHVGEGIGLLLDVEGDVGDASLNKAPETLTVALSDIA